MTTVMVMMAGLSSQGFLNPVAASALAINSAAAAQAVAMLPDSLRARLWSCHRSDDDDDDDG